MPPFHAADAGEPLLLHKAVLQRAVRTLNAAFRWLELAQSISMFSSEKRTSELRHALAALGVLPPDAESQI